MFEVEVHKKKTNRACRNVAARWTMSLVSNCDFAIMIARMGDRSHDTTCMVCAQRNVKWMAWAALHLLFKGIALLVPLVSEFPCFQWLQHCSATSKSPTSCSTDEKPMTHDRISFIEHTCLVLVVNSLVSTFGDGCPVILCL